VHLHIGLNRLDAIVATAANVVSPDIAHLSRDKRRLLVARIATGDWDASDDRSRAKPPSAALRQTRLTAASAVVTRNVSDSSR
jgi:hypothetical protein